MLPKGVGGCESAAPRYSGAEPWPLFLHRACWPLLDCADSRLGAMLPISVLLPVYSKVDVDDFVRAYESVEGQTSPADEIIVIVDGPVDAKIEEFLSSKESDHLTVVRFAENRGLAAGMREGFRVARHRWVARQDSDDVSLPERFERQWPVVSTGLYAAVGGAMLEFDGDPSNVVRTRVTPSEPEDIARYARTHNPMNHPTVIFDREAVAEVGGVHDVHYMEDYDLFARLLSRGYRLRNLREALVLFNAGDDMFDRRTDSRMARAERTMQGNLVRYGLISRPRAAFNFALRQGFRSLPRPLLKFAYQQLFDRRQQSPGSVRLEAKDASA